VIDGAKVREGEERGDGDGEKRAVTATRMRQRRAAADLPSVWVGGRLCHLVKLDRFGAVELFVILPAQTLNYEAESCNCQSNIEALILTRLSVPVSKAVSSRGRMMPRTQKIHAQRYCSTVQQFS
jgi:hypothetical protein